MYFYLVSPKSSIAKRRLRQLGDTHSHFSKSLKKKNKKNPNWTWKKPGTWEQKQVRKKELWHRTPRLTRYWAPKPRGLLVLSLWRLDKSTRAGHSRNMKGHEVSNPSRQPVEMSVRHSASTTFHRAKHLFMSEQIGQSSNLFFLSPDFNAARSAGKECVQTVHFSSHESALTRYKAEYWYWQLLQSYQRGRSSSSRRAADLPPFQLRQVAVPFPSIPQCPLKVNSWAWSKATKANISFLYLWAYLLLSSFSCFPSHLPSLTH